MADAADSAPATTLVFAFDSDEQFEHQDASVGASLHTPPMLGAHDDPRAFSQLQLRVMAALEPVQAECNTHGRDARPATQSHAAASTECLCAALRSHGLDSRLVAPVQLAGRARCGRSSTGGGGRCAAPAGGNGCFFCSRQPYVLVQPPRDSAPPLSLSSCSAAGVVAAGAGTAAPCAGSAALSAGGAAAAAMRTGRVAEEAPVLVELHLRELFRVAPATGEYAAAVEQLPQVWVGPRASLLELAGSMCGAMALNFRVQGLDVPPWRRRSAVLARWDVRSTQHALMSDNEYDAHHMTGQQKAAGASLTRSQERLNASQLQLLQPGAAGGLSCCGPASATSPAVAARICPPSSHAESPAAASLRMQLPAAGGCPAATPPPSGVAPLPGAVWRGGADLPPSRARQCAAPCGKQRVRAMLSDSHAPRVTVYGFHPGSAAQAV